MATSPTDSTHQNSMVVRSEKKKSAEFFNQDFFSSRAKLSQSQLSEKHNAQQISQVNHIHELTLIFWVRGKNLPSNLGDL